MFGKKKSNETPKAMIHELPSYAAREASHEAPPRRETSVEKRESGLVRRAKWVANIVRRKGLLAMAVLGLGGGMMREAQGAPAPEAMTAKAKTGEGKKDTKGTADPYAGQKVTSEQRSFQYKADGSLDSLKQAWHETSVDMNATAALVDEKNAEGNGVNSVEYNPIYPFVPGQITLTRDTERTGEFSIEVSQPWAPHFNQSSEAYTPMGEEADKAMQEAVKQSLLDALANTTHGWNVDLNRDPEVDVSKGGKVEVNNLVITGLASPEGKDPSSVEPGYVGEDTAKNLDLAGARLDTALPAIRDALRAQGVPESVIQNAELRVEVPEFSEDEMYQLIQFAAIEGFDKGSDTQNVYELIKAYNDGKIISPGTNNALDTIVASKRGVQVDGTTVEHGKKETNIPILNLLPLAFLWSRRRRREPPPDQEIIDPLLPPPKKFPPEGETEPPKRPDPDIDPPKKEDPPVGPEQKGSLPPIIELPPEGRTERGGETKQPEPESDTLSPEALAIVDGVALPERGSPEYRSMMLETVGGDLFVYLGDTVGLEQTVKDRSGNDGEAFVYMNGTRNERITAESLGSQKGSEAIQGGIDYEYMVEEAAARMEDGLERRALMNEISLRILEAWRKKNPWPEAREREQIKWAKMHAHVLTQVADEFRKLSQEEQEENMSIRRLFIRDTQYILADWQKVLEARRDAAAKAGREGEALVWEMQALRAAEALLPETVASGIYTPKERLGRLSVLEQETEPVHPDEQDDQETEIAA